MTRIKIPALMLSGRHDMTFPCEPSVKPLFDLLGTPGDEKVLKLFDTDHNIPFNELTNKELAWLDRYLGPVDK